MQLTVVGLGNPGPRYESTRHNVGFRVVDILADRWSVALRKPFLKAYAMARVQVGTGRLALVKPLTFMNRSGRVLPEVLGRAGGGPESLLVVCDTLDLSPGQCRLRRKGSSAGHKGLASIIQALGREDFMRLYLGIGHPGRAEEVVEYVLGEPPAAEAALIQAALSRAADAVAALLTEDPEKVMNELNQRNPDA
ncbi:MAG: aminoacyl-tRNA hydrolase [Spirochaetales bacterium]|nr:aminoacyl-tRNA hydrolase [Spirochaetales bacterium]